MFNYTLIEMAQDNVDENDLAKRKIQYTEMMELREAHDKTYEEYYGKKSKYVWEEIVLPEKNVGPNMEKYAELFENATDKFNSLEAGIDVLESHKRPHPTGTLALSQWKEWTDPKIVERRIVIHKEIARLLPEFNKLFAEYKRVLKLSDKTLPFEFLGHVGEPRVLTPNEVSSIFQGNGLTEAEYKKSLISIKSGIDSMPNEIAEEIKRIEEEAEEIELEKKSKILDKFADEGVVLHRKLGIDIVEKYLSGKDGIQPIPYNLANDLHDSHTIDARIQNAKDILNWMKLVEAHLESEKT